jgi:limonene-1,2-epoxide hydrolase
MPESIPVIEKFIDVWATGDADQMASFFTEDAVYHNMPLEPVHGRAAIRDYLASYLSKMQPETFATVNIAANGDVVMVERRDTFRSRAEGGFSVELPVVGVFEVAGDRIRAWRDYFDFAAFKKALP